MNNQTNFETQLKFQELILKYNAEIIYEKQELVEVLEEYERKILDEYSRNEFLNVKLASNIIKVLKIILEEFSCFSKKQQQYIYVALQYFIEIEDGDDDFESFFGFEDDVEIINEMLCLIGRGNLNIEF